jgi:YVTN family beta-propeller protein
VGEGPHGHIAYSGAADQVWVLNAGAGSISVLSGRTGQALRTIEVGGTPRHVILDDSSGLGYVAVDDCLVVLEIAGGRVSKRIPLPGGRAATCLQPMLGRSRMYVLCSEAGELVAVDTQRQQVAKTLPTGQGSAWGQPHEKPCGRIHIANAASNTVTVIDDVTETVVAEVGVGRRPHRNAIFRERGLMYTADLEDDTVTAISIETDQPVATVPVANRPFRLIGVEKKAGRPELWVLNRGSEARPRGEITVVSATEHTVVNRIQVMERPCNWLFDGPFAHVVGSRTRDLLIVDSGSSSLVGSAELGEDPDPDSFSNMVFGAAGNLFIANAGDSVSLLVPQA